MENVDYIIFGCVVYPAALEYFDEFVESIAEQTEKEFIVLVINDGADLAVLEEKLKRLYRRYDIVSVKNGLSPAQIRVRLIAEAKEKGASILIFGDVDDIFSADRAERVVDVFRNNRQVDFVYNELRTFNDEKVMSDLPEIIEGISTVTHYNFLGMSNTAIRVSALDNNFINSLGECDSFVFDWYLYSRLLLDGHKGIFAQGAMTYYRIYEANCAGLPKDTEKDVAKEQIVKRKHYSILRKYSVDFEQLYDCYKNGDIKRVAEKKCNYWWSLTRSNDIKYTAIDEVI